ncbi:MAG: Gfo/Idh/MocA family oxidoreductase [Anaerolineae bacterium]|nr:Gfo/Idh/MocA family oxidoreductase [Anaerolineae bacterium]
MITVSVIGAGFMGKTHARAYARNPAVRIAYVADKIRARAESLAAEIGAQAITDYDTILLDSSVDLVDVTLPTPFHPEYAIRALEADKHVVVEKPLALNTEEADRMLEAARAAGRFLMVAHVLRFWPEYLAIRSVLDSQRLGAPRQASAFRLSNMPQWSSWFRDPTMTGGGVLDIQIHDLDMLNWLFGKPLRLMSTGLRGEMGGWDHVMTLLEYPSIKASEECSFLMPLDFPFTVGFKVLCERGMIEYYFRAGGASFEMGQPQSHLLLFENGKPNQPIPIDPGDGYERELAYFVDCVDKGREPTIITGAEARLAVQVAQASARSLETGGIVAIE